jgi:uncharacterized membrane protein YgcG
MRPKEGVMYRVWFGLIVAFPILLFAALMWALVGEVGWVLALIIVFIVLTWLYELATGRRGAAGGDGGDSGDGGGDGGDGGC